MANLLEKLTRGSEDLVIHEELKKVRVGQPSCFAACSCIIRGLQGFWYL